MSLFSSFFIVFNRIFNLLMSAWILLFKQLFRVYQILLQKFSYLVHSLSVLHWSWLYIILHCLLQISGHIPPFFVKTSQNVANKWVYPQLRLRFHRLLGLGLTHFWNASVSVNSFENILGPSKSNQHLMSLPQLSFVGYFSVKFLCSLQHLSFLNFLLKTILLRNTPERLGNRLLSDNYLLHYLLNRNLHLNFNYVRLRPIIDYHLAKLTTNYSISKNTLSL